MTRIIVELAADRSRCGILKVLDDRGKKICGPFKVASRANDRLASAKGNPDRNPLFCYGDTPVGAYAVRHCLKSGPRTSFPTAQFGPHGVVVIEPISGDAALAEANGRFHFLISGGDLSKDGKLKSTAGGLRLENGDLRKVLAVLKQSPRAWCEIVAQTGFASRELVASDDQFDCDDPVKLPAGKLASSSDGRETLRGGASAMVLGMTVSFVALQGSSSAHASNAIAPPVASPHQILMPRSGSVMPQNRTQGHTPYVRLAYDAPPGGGYTATAPDTPSSTTSTAPNVIDGSGGQPISGAGVTTGGPSSGGAAPANSALQQLQNATNGQQTTGQTFDNGNGVSDATPSAGNINVPTPSSSPVGGSTSGSDNGAGANSGSSSGDGSGANSSGGGPNAGPINPITGGGQPISGPGVHYGPADTPPPPNPVSSTITNDQSAISAAQSQLDAAVAERNAATSDAARQQAQIKIYNATQELNRANSQLRVDQIKGQ